MQLIQPSYEIWPQGHTLTDIYRHIERCARVCYRSSERITDNSYVRLYINLKKRKHLAMLEHATAYLLIPRSHPTAFVKYIVNPHSRYRHCTINGRRYCAVTTNWRVIVENNWHDDTQYLTEPTPYHIRRVTVRLTTNRQVSHEAVRHRTFSFAQESTRYCNYTHHRSHHGVTFIRPSWLDTASWLTRTLTLGFLHITDWTYRLLVRLGWEPQQAATVLPNATKTELVLTAFCDKTGWQHFFNLRALGTTGRPHPQMQQLALPLYHEFLRQHLIEPLEQHPAKVKKQ